MSKKSGGISSLLKSDRAKKFKDTSFIWDSRSQEEKTSFNEELLEPSNKIATDEDEVNSQEPENGYKQGTLEVQIGNKLGTTIESLQPSQIQATNKSEGSSDDNRPSLNFGPIHSPSENQGTNKVQSGNKLGTGNKSMLTSALHVSKETTKASKPSKVNQIFLDSDLEPSLTDNLGTNKVQSGNKLGTNKKTQNDQIIDTPSKKFSAEATSESPLETSGYNVGTNREQSRNKEGTKQEHSGYKSGTNSQNNLSSKAVVEQSGFKVGTKVSTDLGTKRVQTGCNVGTDLGTNWEQCGYNPEANGSFLALTGLQQKITFFFYEQCKQAGSKTTPSMAIQFIATSLQTNTNSVKVSIKRLQKKGILKKSGFKNGRGGWSNYTLSNDVYREIHQLESGNILGTIWVQTGNKVGTDLSLNRNSTEKKLGTDVGTELGTSVSSSSSFNINNKTTTTGNEFTGDWAKIVFPNVLQQYSFGKNVIQQVMNGELLTPQELQDSLYAFAADITENNLIEKKKIGSVLGYFMAIVRKKIAYPFPVNYKSDEDKALEETKKRLEEIKRKREEREKLALELGFEEWLDTMTQEKANKLVPESVTFPLGHPFCTQMLQGHYKKAILNGMSPDEPLPSEQ